jgi:hypothetical protein
LKGCGATVGNSIQISVISYADSLSENSGNVFIASSAGWDESDTTVIPVWLDDNSILIRYDSARTIFKKDSIINQIRISYVPK